MEDRQHRLKEINMADLDDALADLRRSMENFATAYGASVARMLDRELRIATPMVDLEPSGRMTKVEMACPNTAEHPRHVWSFPKSVQSRQCPGVPTPRAFPEEWCMKTDAHAPHDWETFPTRDAETGLGRHCPGRGGVPAERQCTDWLAHHTHVWWADAVNGREVKRGTPEAVKFGCPGLETDLVVKACPNTRDGDHWAHALEGGVYFCKGFADRYVPVMNLGHSGT